MPDFVTDTQTSGPFQKYLLSGACYVQVGECYAQLCADVANHDSSTCRDMAARLAALWHDQARGQVAMTNWIPPGIGELLTAGAGNNLLVDLHQSLLEINREATETLLGSLLSSDVTLPDFDEFFEQWTRICADAYGRYVRSDQFVQSFGNATNLWIRQGQ